MELISKAIAQQIVDTVKDVCSQNINFIDAKGIIIASTDPSRIDTFHEIGYRVVSTGDTLEVADDDSFFGTKRGINLPVSYNGQIVAAIGISGEVEEVRKYAHLARTYHRYPSERAGDRGSGYAEKESPALCDPLCLSTMRQSMRIILPTLCRGKMGCRSSHFAVLS